MRDRDRSGVKLTWETHNAAMLLLLSSEPINEPVVGLGPFVMTIRAEIAQAIDGFNGGRFDTLALPPGPAAAISGH